MDIRKRMTYPTTARDDVVDDYHGTLVEDPYRWLEDLDSPETAAWVAEQNRLTSAHLDTIPFRERIRARLTALWEHDEFGVPGRAGDRLFYTYRARDQTQATLVSLRDGEQDARVLLDPNSWSEDGTIALTGVAITLDGTLLTYGVSEAGSDRQIWRVLDVERRAVLSDELRDVKFTQPVWRTDRSGFFYGYYPQGTEDLAGINLGQQLMFHRIGSEQAADELVLRDPENPDRLYGPRVTEDGAFLIIDVYKGSADTNEVYLKRLDRPDAAVEPLFTGFDAQYGYERNVGDEFVFWTNKDAPLGRLASMSLSDPSTLTDVIPQSDAALVGVNTVGGKYFATYLRDAATEIKVFALDGTLERTLDLPALGTASGFGGRDQHTETYYAFQSYAHPPTIYRYDIASGTSTVFARDELPLDPATITTERVFVTSKDGTRFPVFLTRRSDVTPSSDTPTLLYGYGGFNNAMVPGFTKSAIPWIEAGGVYAVACIRGGGEYGEEWHRAGTKERKQNVFDDFIATAEWLITSEQTSRARLAIQGGSNGGLLVGACITQRPDLFAAANIGVGVLDMLRYHRFTIGWAWADDYGTADDPEAFKYLYAYSPLHNIEPGTAYPAVMLTTGDHDDRVVPAHSFKFAATLQPAQGSERPILLRVDVRAGHGMGKPTDKIIAASTDVLAFLMSQLRVVQT